MKKWILTLYALSLLGGCHQYPQKDEVSVSLARPRGGGEIRVATWNVRNLFDPVDDPNEDEVPSAAEYERKLSQLASVVEELESDFLALEEVENIGCLRDLNNRLTNPYPQIGLLEGNDTMRGIDVAFLSRLPVEELRSHRERQLPAGSGVARGYRFSRDCLEVRLKTQPPLILLVNHLKSARGDGKESAAKRRVQALGVVEVAQEVASRQEGPLVVLGDLNDRPDSWALEPLFKEFHDPFKGLSRPQRVTHRYKKGGSAIDHILLNDQAAQIAGAGRIWSGSGEETSDHDPLTLQLAVTPLERAPAKEWTAPTDE